MSAALRGVSMAQIAHFLGDTVQTVERNYLHLQPDHLRGVLPPRKGNAASAP
jgi:hypothetical protein